LKKKHKK